MNYQALKSELVADPAGVGYSSMTATQAATAINASTYPGPYKLVPLGAILAYLRTQGAWLGIKAAAASNTAAAAAVDLESDPHAQNLDVSLPQVSQMLASLVSAGLLTAAQSSAIVAMGQTMTSRAQVIGWTIPPTAADISAARGM
ncbi:MAG: hypothetical protein F8N39_05805 [Clostridiaceae bacterium]|nr:hypothetical protein [Clostridiaceae bacterium]